MTLAEEVAEQARRAVNEVVSAQFTRMQFRVDRFDRHPDGYLHARVLAADGAHYFHRKYGSWLAPGHIGGRSVLKEPEALLGSQLGREVKFKLSELSQPFDQAARRERALREERERAKTGPRRPSSDPEGTGEAAGADRVPDGGDRQGDHPEPQPDGE